MSQCHGRFLFSFSRREELVKVDAELSQGGAMEKKWRTVQRFGDSGRLDREEARAVFRALRDGTPLPKVTPIGTKKPEAAVESTQPPRP
jgi:hypothetical protein